VNGAMMLLHSVIAGLDPANPSCLEIDGCPGLRASPERAARKIAGKAYQNA
jgi:hypothetical protein